MKRSGLWAVGAVIAAVILVAIVLAVTNNKDTATIDTDTGNSQAGESAANSEAAPQDVDNSGSGPSSLGSGSEGDATGQQSGSASIAIEGYAFSPDTITVKKGSSITWTNNDAVVHTVTPDDPDETADFIDSGDIAPGGTYTLTFNEAGNYAYHCRPHPDMKARIVVID